MILVAIALQLSCFLDINFNKYIAINTIYSYQHYVSNIWNN